MVAGIFIFPKLGKPVIGKKSVCQELGMIWSMVLGWWQLPQKRQPKIFEIRAVYHVVVYHVVILGGGNFYLNPG